MSDSKIIIRPAIAGDVSTIIDIEKRGGLKFADIGMEWVAERPSSNRAEIEEAVRAKSIFVAEEASTLLGFIYLGMVDDHGHILEVSVDYKMQGKGIGGKLMQKAELWAKHHDFHALSLTTFKHVPFNGPWYQSQGFTEIDPGASYPELDDIIKSERRSDLNQSERIAMIKLLDI